MNEITSVGAATQPADNVAVKFNRMLRLFKEKIRCIAVSTVVVLVAVGVYVFSLPREYRSETILLPETSSEGISGNIGALASAVGMKMGNTSEDAIYPEFYPKVLGSTVFLAELLKENVALDRLGKKVSIFDYFAKYQKRPWWGSLFAKKDKTVDPRVNPVKITKEQQAIVNLLISAFFCSVDKKTDMVMVSVVTQDAEVSAQIADIIRCRLQGYITDYRTNKARKDLEYAKKITSESKAQYIKLQQKYAAYCDANEDIMLASFIQVRNRLENDMQIAYNMYQQSMQQLQLAQAKLQERTPVFVTIQPATVPSKPSGPKRMITMFMFMLLVPSCCFAYFLLKDIYNTKVRNAVSVYEEAHG